MNRIFLVLVTLGLLSCHQNAHSNNHIQQQIDSLKNELKHSYKPGFGEFMTYIQSQHAKLWYAGKNDNWKLADFELHEIMETVEAIQSYETDREETKLIQMIKPALDSVNKAISEENHAQFVKNFTLLTNTCNNCHLAANFEFNVVKIPEENPYSNQDFKKIKP